jgi:hypothetical protein
MKRYLLKVAGMPDRVLYVRRGAVDDCWVVAQLPVNPAERHYPDNHWWCGRCVYNVELPYSFTRDAMQSKLDAYAKKYGLEEFVQESEGLEI